MPTATEKIFDETLIAATRLSAEAHAHFLALIAPTIDFYVSRALTRDLANALGELLPPENETMGLWSLAVLEGDLLRRIALEAWFITDLGICSETIKAARGIVAFAFEHRPLPKRERRIPTQTTLIRKGTP